MRQLIIITMGLLVTLGLYGCAEGPFPVGSYPGPGGPTGGPALQTMSDYQGIPAAAPRHRGRYSYDG